MKLLLASFSIFFLANPTFACDTSVEPEQGFVEVRLNSADSKDLYGIIAYKRATSGRSSDENTTEIYNNFVENNPVVRASSMSCASEGCSLGLDSLAGGFAKFAKRITEKYGYESSVYGDGVCENPQYADVLKTGLSIKDINCEKLSEEYYECSFLGAGIESDKLSWTSRDGEGDADPYGACEAALSDLKKEYPAKALACEHRSHKGVNVYNSWINCTGRDCAQLKSVLNLGNDENLSINQAFKCEVDESTVANIKAVSVDTIEVELKNDNLKITSGSLKKNGFLTSAIIFSQGDNFIDVSGYLLGELASQVLRIDNSDATTDALKAALNEKNSSTNYSIKASIRGNPSSLNFPEVTLNCLTK